jgi:hypothetical protein
LIEVLGLLAAIACVAVLVLGVVPQAHAQSNGTIVKHNASTDIYYMLVLTPNLNQEQAAAAALRLRYANRPGKLAEYKSANTDIWLRDNFGSQALHRVWIGGYRRKETQPWRWMSNDSNISAFFWASESGEPNNVGTSNPSTGIYLYAYPGKQAKWADVNRASTNTAGFLVEFPPPGK